MVDILINHVDPDTMRRLNEKAAAKGVSLNDIAIEAIIEYVKDVREDRDASEP
jgi:predicted HicB family RNase H-like nuclease